MASEIENNYSGHSESNSTLSETIVVTNCLLNAPLMLISIIGNTVVLAAILRTPSLRSPSTVFLCSLALSDLLVGLVVQPVYIANAVTGMTYMQKTMATMAFAASGVSLFTMTAIAVDRFLALHYHMRYPNLMTTGRATYLSATLWIAALLLSFSHHWSDQAYLVTVAVSIITCLLTCTACYIKIYRIVRQHQLQIQVLQQAVASLIIAENNQNIQKSTKSAKSTFIYYIAMVICYLPMFITKAIASVFPDQWTSAWILTETVVFMNSSINPFLYCWRLRELRAAVLKTIKQMLCQLAEEN